jgi:hypothetical protein
VLLFGRIKRFDDTFVKPANSYIFVKRDKIFLVYQNEKGKSRA